jgi:hypothetical protein
MKLSQRLMKQHTMNILGGIEIRKGDDKSLAFRFSYFLICSTTKRIFLGWVKEVRTTKS